MYIEYDSINYPLLRAYWIEQYEVNGESHVDIAISIADMEQQKDKIWQAFEAYTDYEEQQKLAKLFNILNQEYLNGQKIIGVIL